MSPFKLPKVALPPVVVKVLRVFPVPAVHTVCGQRNYLEARWVRYANGRVNCEVKNRTCPVCLSGDPWDVDLEAVRAEYDPKWGKVGPAA